MTQTFTVIVERDAETRWLVAEVLELPGCFTEAPDMAALEANIQEAIQVYLETVEIGEPLPDYVGTWRVEVAM